MARWHGEGHAACGKSILSRIAGAPESSVAELSFAQVDGVLACYNR